MYNSNNMFALVAYCAIFGCLARGQTSNFQKLLDVDTSLYGRLSQSQSFPNVSLSSQSDAELSTARTKRQTTTAICVPTGTCITTTPGGGIIDPRIVTPGQATTSAPPTTCPTGQQLCTGTAAQALCGQRNIAASSVTDVDGSATLGAFPWQAYIRNQTGYTGSGVLLDTLNVLTAAHKVNLNVATPGNIIVNIGVYDPVTSLTTSQQRTVASMVIHESFDATTLRNDIAVLRLNAAVALGYQINVGSACLPAAGTSYVGQRCVVSGWGRSGFTVADAPTSPQKQVRVPIVDYTTCRNSMAQATVLGSLANADRFLDPNGELCAGGEANRDACTSDGGSPLVCADATGRWNIAGLVIWGKNCGQTGVYGVYVDVPKYRTWIDGAITRLNAG